MDDRDLMSVISEEEIAATPTPQIVYVTPEPTEMPQQVPPIVVEDDNSDVISMLLLVIGIAAVGGAVFWVVRQKKINAAQQVPDFEDEYNFEEDENEEE